MKDKDNDMSSQSVTPAPMWRGFLVFLLPLMAQNILQSLGVTINNIFVGRLLGVEALASASMFFPVAFFFIAFLIGISAGASVLIGQAFGAGNLDLVRRITGTTLSVALIGGVVVGVFGSTMARPIMQALNAPPEIFDEATHFAHISFMTMPVTFMFIIGSSLLRGVRDTMRPLAAQAGATLMAAGMTPLLIRHTSMGAAAAPVSMAMAQTVALVILGVYLYRIKHPMAPDRALWACLRPDWGLLKTVLRVGLPTGVQVVIGSISGLVIIKLVNAFGHEATAAYGAVSQIQSYVQFPALSIAIAASIWGAQMIGAGRADRLDEVLKTALSLNLLLTGGLVALAYLFSRPMIGLFITDASVIETAQRLLHIVTWSSLMFGAGSIFSGLMRASGTVIPPMLIAVFCILGIELPVAVLLSKHIGLDGIWWGYVSSFAMLMVLQGAYYMLIWRKKTIVALV